jgi:hypothetical protein
VGSNRPIPSSSPSMLNRCADGVGGEGEAGEAVILQSNASACGVHADENSAGETDRGECITQRCWRRLRIAPEMTLCMERDRRTHSDRNVNVARGPEATRRQAEAEAEAKADEAKREVGGDCGSTVAWLPSCLLNGIADTSSRSCSSNRTAVLMRTRAQPPPTTQPPASMLLRASRILLPVPSSRMPPSLSTCPDCGGFV